MENNEQTLFRKKAMDRISSPEELTAYLRVTSPGIWVILAAVIFLLAGLLAWASVGTLETKARAKVVVQDHTAEVILIDAGTLSEGMILRVSSQETTLASVQEDEYGRMTGQAEVAIPDGTYDGTVVTDQTKPMDFLTKSR